jgi:transcriptional regulator with XRE-family HTH domain
MSPPGPTAEQLGRHLQALREGAGLSIPELAQRGEIAVERVVMIENGLVDPTLNDLERLALGLNLPLSVLFRKWEHRLN